MTAAAAVVLAGGAARRLGGVDKCALDVGGRPVLARVLDALAGAAVAGERVVVVGPHRAGLALPEGVRVARERPAGGGPVAAVAAGSSALLGTSAAPDPVDALLVVAGDLPLLDAATLRALVEALPGLAAPDVDRDHPAGVDVAVAVDADGVRQSLVAAWRPGALRRALGHGDPAGRSARSLLDVSTVVEVPVDGDPSPLLDVDTADDLARVRTALAGTLP